MDKLIAQALTGAHTPGAAVALIVDGRPWLEQGAGYRDLAQTEPLPVDARFYLYSITKTLIAIAVLQLVEQGPLTLDDPLREHLPAVPLEERVSVRQLLQHTGGLPDYGGLQNYTEAVRQHPGTPWTEKEFLAHTLSGGLHFPPGTGWSYSNIGYLLLKQLIRRLTGRSLQWALHEHLFAPLGLSHTFVAGSPADSDELTPGYSAFFNDEERLEEISGRYHPGWVSHGVVISTAPETARLFHALFAGHLLPPHLLAQMVVPVPVPVTHPLFVRPSYGLGLMLDPDSPYGLIAGHGGGGPGYDTAALHFADVGGREVVAVVLANAGRPLAMDLAFRLVEQLQTGL